MAPVGSINSVPAQTVPMTRTIITVNSELLARCGGSGGN
jgi:hypothetical protein